MKFDIKKLNCNDSDYPYALNVQILCGRWEVFHIYAIDPRNTLKSALRKSEIPFKEGFYG